MIAPIRPLHARRSDGEGAAVRWFICAVVLLALTPRAFADDLDILRGTESVGAATFPRWSGFYFGGQVDYSDGSADFNNATQPLLAFSSARTGARRRRHAVALAGTGQSAHPAARGSAVLSATARNGRISSSAWKPTTRIRPSPSTAIRASPIARVVTAGHRISIRVNVDGSGSLQVTDIGSLRARAGWAFGNFLPYGFAGVARRARQLQRHHTGVRTTDSDDCTAAGHSAATRPMPPTCVDYSYQQQHRQNERVAVWLTRSAAASTWRSRPTYFCAPNIEYIQFAPVREHYGRDLQRARRRRPEF